MSFQVQSLLSSPSLAYVLNISFFSINYCPSVNLNCIQTGNNTNNITCILLKSLGTKDVIILYTDLQMDSFEGSIYIRSLYM